MTRFLSAPSLRRRFLDAGAVAFASLLPVTQAVAQVFQGTGLTGGLQHASGLQGISQSSDLRQSILNVLVSVLNMLAIVSVATVVIAGIYLIISLGEEDNKEKAKKTIYYTLIGLTVILLARVIVGLVTVFLKNRVS